MGRQTIVDHGRRKFKCLEKRLTVGADCECVVGVVGGGPFQGELHDRRRGERRAAKVTPVEDGRIGRVVAGHDYSRTTISGSSYSRAVSVDG